MGAIAELVGKRVRLYLEEVSTEGAESDRTLGGLPLFGEVLRPPSHGLYPTASIAVAIGEEAPQRLRGSRIYAWPSHREQDLTDISDGGERTAFCRIVTSYGENLFGVARVSVIR